MPAAAWPVAVHLQQRRCRGSPLRSSQISSSEIERCVKQHGFNACKLYPSCDHFDPRDERLDPIYKKLVELDVTMQVHMG
jgi:predicted TIM-barrel fold metal-dependent hydrolase